MQNQMRRVRPQLEALEDRQLLATNITFNAASGVFSIHGSSLNDAASVRTQQGQVIADVRTVDSAGNVTTSKTVSVDASRVTQIVFYGYNGNDRFTNGTSMAALVHGGNGDDVICGGCGRDAAYGEAGNDTLFGSEGNDLLDGGDGHDYLYGQEGTDVLSGGAGNDIIYAGKGKDTVHGGTGHDRLYGAEGQDVLYGEAGNDYLNGGPNGNLGPAVIDYINGGAGNNTIER